MGAVFKTLFIILLCSAATPAFAQQNNNATPKAAPYKVYETPLIQKNVDYISTAYYKALARQAIDMRPDNFDFTTFRSYYTQTETYDPLGELTRRKMVNLAYTARHDPDPEKRDAAMAEYADLLGTHLANIDVVIQAKALSEADRAFGDPKFFDWMRGGLLRDVVNSGDGTNLSGAYDVMTLGEESLLMNALGVKLLRSESAEEGGVYYTMNEVADPKVKEPYWIFVNVTPPLVFLEQQKKQMAAIISIPRQ